jgi:surface polysaccharide O-acyltransferase-like enzyme
MRHRIYSFDTLRAVAIFFVITIHTDPFNDVGLVGNVINFTIDTTARFAVPLFFLVAGYLFSINLHYKGENYVRAYLSRVAATYAFGVFVALPVRLLIGTGSIILTSDSIVPRLAAELLRVFDSVDILYYGLPIMTMGHLWFLAALGYSILIIYFAQRQGWIFYLLILATALHGIGISVEAYRFATDFPFKTRHVLFFGLFYTTTGYWLERQSYSVRDTNSRAILSLVVAFGLLHLIERYFLGYILDLASGPLSETVFTVNYSLLTPFFTVAIFLFALSTPKLGEGSYLQRFGVLTIGIYVLHIPVLFLLRNMARLISIFTVYTPSETIIWHIVLTPVVYVLSLFGYIALGRLNVVNYFYEYREF